MGLEYRNYHCYYYASAFLINRRQQEIARKKEQEEREAELVREMKRVVCRLKSGVTPLATPVNRHVCYFLVHNVVFIYRTRTYVIDVL